MERLKKFRVWFPADPEYLDEQFGECDEDERAWIVVSVKCRNKNAAAVLAFSALRPQMQECADGLYESDITIEEVE